MNPKIKTGVKHKISHLFWHYMRENCFAEKINFAKSLFKSCKMWYNHFISFILLKGLDANE